jgi:mRNA-degrading endonuclease RelE of RelBE toxin-antitoxin system
LRVGVYRIVYEIDDDAKSIIVEYVRHRSGAYRR